MTGRFAPQRRSLLPRFFDLRFFTDTDLRSPEQHQLLQAETWRAQQAAPLQCAVYAIDLLREYPALEVQVF